MVWRPILIKISEFQMDLPTSCSIPFHFVGKIVVQKQENLLH